jgi:hypothetical protein
MTAAAAERPGTMTSSPARVIAQPLDEHPAGVSPVANRSIFSRCHWAGAATRRLPRLTRRVRAL